MRQQGDDQKEFREILNSLSDGTLTHDQWKKLKERDLTGGNFSPEGKKAIYEKSTMVCAPNEDKEESQSFRNTNCWYQKFKQ